MPRLEIEIAASNDKLKDTVKSSLGVLSSLQTTADNLKIELFKASSVQEINKIGGALTAVTGQMKSYITEATKGSEAFKDQKATAIIDNLNAKLLSITGNAQLFGSSLKNNTDEVKAYQSALDALLKAGVNPLDARVKGLTQSINSLNSGMATKRQSDLVRQFKDTGAIIPDLESKIKRLKLALSGATSTREIALYNIRLKESQNELTRLRNIGLQTTNAVKTGFDGAKNSVNQFNASLNKSSSSNGIIVGIKGQIGGLVSTYASLYAVVAGVGTVVSSNAKLSDSLTDVARTADLTDEETSKLLSTFKQFDNRTGLKGLADIAVIAGQMGIDKREIAGFTETLDQLATVLKNEIKGGAEEVASSLGKINGVFDIASKEGITAGEAMNKTGSAILKLGQDGLATGEFLTDFSQRVAGIAKASSISLPAVLAYGSVMEEAGVRAEVAGTALNRFVSSLAGKRNEFFTIAKLADANLTIKDFTRLINTDADAAMQLFFKGLNSGNPSLTTFNDRLAVIAMRAGPSKNAIIALAQNQEKLAEKTRLATEEFDNGTLVQEQYDRKNSNLAASTDHFRKSLENLTTSTNAQTFFKGIIDSLTDIISSFDRVVSSKSWTEFFTRIDRLGQGEVIDFEIKYDSATKANEEIKKLINSTKSWEEADSLFKGLGADKFNKELGLAKDNFDNILKASTAYEAAVREGRLKEEKVTVDQYNKELELARNHYSNMITLQKRLGFGASAGTGIIKAKVEDDESEELTKKQLASREAYARKIENLLAESRSRAAIAADEDRKRDLKRIELYYQKSFEIAEGNSAVTSELTANKRAEIAAVNEKWDAKELEQRQKIDNEINSILERSLIEKTRTRKQELDFAQAVYNEQVVKYKDSTDQLSKLDEAYRNNKEQINAKYDDKDFQAMTAFTEKINRSREKALIDQLEDESRIKITAAKGDEEKLNAIYSEFAKKRQDIIDQQAQINIIANNDGSPLYKEIAQAELALQELRKQFSDGLISQESFDKSRERLDGIISKLDIARSVVFDLADLTSTSFMAILTDGENAAATIGRAFKSMANQIIADLIRIQATKALASLFTGGGLGILGKLVGFSSGGYTGNVGRNQVAGVVHGQEFVVNADAAGKNRALLEAINGGRNVGTSANMASSVSANPNSRVIVEVEGEISGENIRLTQKRANQRNNRFFATS